MDECSLCGGRYADLHRHQRVHESADAWNEQLDRDVDERIRRLHDEAG